MIGLLVLLLDCLLALIVVLGAVEVATQRGDSRRQALTIGQTVLAAGCLTASLFLRESRSDADWVIDPLLLVGCGLALWLGAHKRIKSGASHE